MDTLPVQPDTHALALPQSFRLTAAGLAVVGEPTFDEWLACGKLIYQYNESIHFAIGDWLSIGELRWGETYRQAVLAFGFDIQTLRDDKWVASRIAPERRRPELSFSHHRVVATLQPERQEELLDAAVTQKLTRNAFRKYVDEQVYMPTAAAPKQAVAHHAGAPIENDTAHDLTPLVTAAAQLIAAIDAIDFTTVPAKDRTDVFEQLGNVRNRIDGLFMSYEDQ